MLHAVTGGGAAQLTTNGDSFEPVWARSGIVFDRSTPCGLSKAPIYQLWIDAAGKMRQLTHLRVPALLSGLAPLEASADGNRLIAEYGGEDTSYAWTVQLSPLQVRPLTVAGKSVDAEQVQGDRRSRPTVGVCWSMSVALNSRRAMPRSSRSGFAGRHADQACPWHPAELERLEPHTLHPGYGDDI